MKISVLGAGAWGTALARLLHQGGHQLTLWGHDAEGLEEIRRAGRNERFLPGIDIPREIALQKNISQAVSGADCVVMAVPSKAFREVARNLETFPGTILSVTKCIEYESGLTMSGILREVAPAARHAALSGPTFAIEVAQDIPTAIVAASD